jgi:hypothetical protein
MRRDTSYMGPVRVPISAAASRTTREPLDDSGVDHAVDGHDLVLDRLGDRAGLRHILDRDPGFLQSK